MVEPHDEAVRERALREWASSRYAELETLDVPIQWYKEPLFEAGFTSYDTDRLDNPKVVKWNGRYWMYYSGTAGGTDYIVVNSSPNGVTDWRNEGYVTVDGATWHRSPQDVLVVDDEIWLYSNEVDANDNVSINLFTSTDGLSFTDQGIVLMVDEGRDELPIRRISPRTMELTSIARHGGRWYMVYNLMPDDPLSGRRATSAWFLAESTDGKSWSRMARILQRDWSRGERWLRQPNLIPPGEIGDRWWHLFHVKDLTQRDAESYQIKLGSSRSDRPTQITRHGRISTRGYGGLINSTGVDSHEYPYSMVESTGYLLDEKVIRTWTGSLRDESIYYCEIPTETFLTHRFSVEARWNNFDEIPLIDYQISTTEDEYPTIYGVNVGHLGKKTLLLANTMDVDATVYVDVNPINLANEYFTQVGGSTTVASGSQETIVVNDQATLLRIRASAAASPTSGKLMGYVMGRAG